MMWRGEKSCPYWDSNSDLLVRRAREVLEFKEEEEIQTNDRRQVISSGECYQNRYFNICEV
jgi:hypothetical protein